MGTRILLDLDPVADQLAGTIAVDDGPAEPFSGWLALGHAVHQALGAAGVQPGDAAFGEALDGGR